MKHAIKIASLQKYFYKFAELNFKFTDCYCFADLYSVSIVPNAWRDFTCSGNPNQLCGGMGNVTSLYTVGK